MVKVKEDMTGWVMAEHGVPDSKLIVLKQTEDYICPCGRHMDQWLCECSCEEHNTVLVIGRNLKAKNGTKSCGCLRRKRMSNLNSKNNIYDIKSCNYGIGWTSNTNKEFYFDLEDYDKINNYCWYENVGKDGYSRLVAYIKELDSYKTMAQLLVGDYYDHKDRNPLNNRKYNLRQANKFQNAQNHNKQKNNTSGIIGVGWHELSNKWYARIRVNNKEMWLGLFSNKIEAIIARFKAEVKYYGEFAPQRHLFKEYGIESEDNKNE